MQNAAWHAADQFTQGDLAGGLRFDQIDCRISEYRPGHARKITDMGAAIDNPPGPIATPG